MLIFITDSADEEDSQNHKEESIPSDIGTDEEENESNDDEEEDEEDVDDGDVDEDDLD